MAKIENPILRRFRAALDKVYGDKIERVSSFLDPAHVAMRVQTLIMILLFS